MTDDERRKIAFKLESYARFALDLESRFREVDDDRFQSYCSKLLTLSRFLVKMILEGVKDDDTSFKRCTKCGEEKRLTEYYKQIRSKGGYGSHCKECHKSYQRKK